ncbi:hypothetical protein, partial [Ilumatobacter sp.]|uniref:hypothetical protein n=1 Tax=Ilumatobacter sp. TaxID=1967498 RepID=UPI003B52D49A
DDTNSYAAAGGGIRIEARRLLGGTTGTVRANGGSGNYPGAGGRIGIDVESDAYAGALQARAGRGRRSRCLGHRARGRHRVPVGSPGTAAR